MAGVFCRRGVTEGLDRGPETAAKRLLELLPGSRIVCLKQIHSDIIVRAEDAAGGGFPEADGVISLDPDLVLCVRTADCVPVLMWADDAPVIAAVHAGWRGLAAGIIPKAVRLMGQCGARQIHVCMGPSIGPCCYAVGPEVMDALNAGPSRTKDGRASVDLHQVACVQARSAGIHEENIHRVVSCTCCNSREFYSFRRDGEHTGRNLSVIGGASCSLPGLLAR